MGMDGSNAFNTNLRECRQSRFLFTHTCGQDGTSQKHSKLQLEKSETGDKIIDPALISLHCVKQKGN